jgi:hypothetical protein
MPKITQGSGDLGAQIFALCEVLQFFVVDNRNNPVHCNTSGFYLNHGKKI